MSGQKGYGVLAAGALLVTAWSAAASASPPHRQVHDAQQLSAATPFPACAPSDDFRDLATEPTVAVLPGRPQVRIAAWIQDNADGIVTAHTSDGGRSWQRVVPGGLAACSGSTYGYRAAYDPWLSVGPDRVAYLVAGANSPPTGLPDPASASPFDGSVQLVRSNDGGASWQPPVVVARDVNSSFILDKPTVTADPRRAGVVYATWTRIGGLGASAAVEVARSTDHGTSWTTHEVSPPPGSIYTGSQVLVLPDGGLVLTLVQASAQPLAVTGTFLGDTTVLAYRSHDGGSTWQGPSEIGTADGAPSLYSAATDGRGRLAVAWVHLGGIDLGRSDDGGVTWRTGTAVPATHQPFLPTVAAGDDGRLYLLYDDHRSHRSDGTPLTEVWLAESGPGALAWHDVAHLGGPFDMATAPSGNGAGGDPLGDYQGIALAGREVAVLFGQDRPTSTVGATGVFSATVR